MFLTAFLFQPDLESFGAARLGLGLPGMGNASVTLSDRSGGLGVPVIPDLVLRVGLVP